MTPYWFAKQLPPSRHGLENAVRLSLWASGFGDSYITCAKAEPPVKCQGLWRSVQPFSIEWVPLEYFALRLQEPNTEILEAFERVLGHRALAGYRDQNGDVVVEWRVNDPDGRYAELQQGGAKDLERLS